VSALQGLRILELASGVAGEYCGKLLADFGAEIVKIETPVSGSATRHMSPFALHGTECERSGLFAYLNAGKQSVTLDLTDAMDREQLRRLAGTVDALIDDHARGFLEALVLSPATCAAQFPALVLCAVTPFGYDAPTLMQKAYSLNVMQSSGWGYHSPTPLDPGTPPLKGPGRFLVDYESGLSSAMALLAALYHKTVAGQGQFVDVSQQASLAALSDYVLAQMAAGHMDVSTERSAFDLGGPATFFECRDGYIYLFMTEPAHWNGLYQLMGKPAWMLEFPERWLELHLTPERIQRCRSGIAAWLKDHARSEVAARAQQLGVAMVPVNTVSDIRASAQLQHRGFFASVRHPVLGELQQPLTPSRFSATPARIVAPAPALGEHTAAVLARVSRDTAARKKTAPPATIAASHGQGPLHGVRVLEHTKVWAGPYTGKLLALLGAEVIRVESLDSLDVTRRYGVKDINAAPGFQAVNPGKLSVQLSLRTAEGRNLMKELVRRSDILVENLRPGALARQGLDYQALRAIRPDIIAVSMSMWGNEGPLSYQTGYAPSFSALSGLCHMMGLPEGPPKLLNIRYGDSTFGTCAAFAALVALNHRRRTGQGQYIDVSAVESIASMLGDVFVDHAITGIVPSRDGNRHAELAPHGCYPCAEHDWISIAVRTDSEWRALCAHMTQPALAQDPRFNGLRARQLHAVELDRLLETWTRTQDARELSAALRARGVAAFKSLNSVDLVADEQLWRHGFYQTVTDSAGQSSTTTGAPWRLSLTPAGVSRAAPRLGEHNDYVLGELLGLSASERERLRDEKIVY
jgi:crotonobetainyl-CoA:carnitine CoA-transferase CaiB-like acyl-CoA transferase